MYFCNRNPCTVIDAVNYRAGKLPLKTYNQPFELYKPKEMWHAILLPQVSLGINLRKWRWTNCRQQLLEESLFCISSSNTCRINSGLQVFWKYTDHTTLGEVQIQIIFRLLQKFKCEINRERFHMLIQRKGRKNSGFLFTWYDLIPIASVSRQAVMLFHTVTININT